MHAEALIRFEGSSPLTRGKHPARGHVVEQEGLIPTHAGKTRGPGRARTRWGAHPHSRGENVRALAFMVPIVSSSPLMRGKLRVARTGQVVDGLIPAHAGKTLPGKASTRPHRAHPRSRGENRALRGGRALPLGSSPLTRGKLDQRRTTARLRGLIPAHAGKTTFAPICVSAPRAHPRSRGENGTRR